MYDFYSSDEGHLPSRLPKPCFIKNGLRSNYYKTANDKNVKSTRFISISSLSFPKTFSLLLLLVIKIVLNGGDNLQVYYHHFILEYLNRMKINHLTLIINFPMIFIGFLNNKRKSQHQINLLYHHYHLL